MQRPMWEKGGILIDNRRAVPVYLIHKTGKIADVQVNRHEKCP